MTTRERRSLADDIHAQYGRIVAHLGQPWIDDPSNEDLRFERVRVRKAMPREEVPRLSARAELARAAVMDLALKADVAFAHHLGRNALGYFSLGRNEARLMLADLLCEVLLRMLALTGGGARPLRAQLRALVGDLRGPEPFRRTLAGSLIAARKDDVILCREAGRISPEQVMPEEGRMLWDNRFHLTAPAGAVIRPIGQRNATRHHEAPAYVVAALPSVEIPGQIPFFPHFTPVSGCAVTPNERFLP